MNFDWNVIFEDPQGLPNPVARDAAANRKQLGDEPIHFMPNVVLIERETEIRDVYSGIGH